MGTVPQDGLPSRKTRMVKETHQALPSKGVRSTTRTRIGPLVVECIECGLDLDMHLASVRVLDDARTVDAA